MRDNHYNCEKIFLTYCVKSVHIRSYSFRMRENTDQNNSGYGNFLRTDNWYWSEYEIYMRHRFPLWNLKSSYNTYKKVGLIISPFSKTKIMNVLWQNMSNFLSVILEKFVRKQENPVLESLFNEVAGLQTLKLSVQVSKFFECPSALRMPECLKFPSAQVPWVLECPWSAWSSLSVQVPLESLSSALWVSLDCPLSALWVKTKFAKFLEMNSFIVL